MTTSAAKKRDNNPAATFNRSEMAEGLTLSKEQAAILLALLPAALAQSSSSTSFASKDAVTDGVRQYSNEEMFARKKKNTKSTPAQNYLLVSNILLY